MRPLRLALALLSCVFAFSFLLYYGATRSQAPFDYQQSRVGAYFSWRAPSSLFPPSAVISLTDDNSTFFLARPAAFGPTLPARSLSGQLWVGTGFGDDNLGRSGSGSNPEGELGCSDVPGWSISERKRGSRPAMGEQTSMADERSPGVVEDSTGLRNTALIDTSKDDDGTDDHLLVDPAGSGRQRKIDQTQQSNTEHADIQSLQESAEIADKIVLLSRGGCGFLDKVKWAQRRGAVAVIIGDNIRAGPLVTMYARGDTTNISISALFTSHTTAHLLSSLMPQGNKTTHVVDDANRLGVAIGDSMRSVKKGQAKTRILQQLTTTAEHEIEDQHIPPPRTQQGWFWALFGSDNRPSQRPPSSGNVGWSKPIITDEVDVSMATKGSKETAQLIQDSFKIGVHDWRDPDLVAEQKEQRAKLAEKGEVKRRNIKDDSTPSSGEYKSSSRFEKLSKDKSKLSTSKNLKQKPKGWLRSSGNTNEKDGKVSVSSPGSTIIDPVQPVSNPVHMHDIQVPGVAYGEPTEHEGLWITLTPTSMSSSPFVDTLLVLVVSPLVTLSVVYVLLLLRSRIRRRRWRAPKSVVERLPVRTYQTMSSAPTSSTTSSISTTPTANTPLLSAARPVRPRPRSRTASEHPQASASQSFDQEEEKREAGLSEWRRKYGGKQKECVVCLEEYVDGVSRVMSLPCGHEFHEGCITPWLTTRRRTCPICKGDVVRSLARSYGSTSSMPHREDEAEEDIQEQAVLNTNDDPMSQRPVSSNDDYTDLERGVVEDVDHER